VIFSYLENVGAFPASRQAGNGWTARLLQHHWARSERTDFEADAALSRLARTPDRVPTGLLRKKVRILGKYCRPGKYAPVHGLGLFI
jgi:hypothetical protein